VLWGDFAKTRPATPRGRGPAQKSPAGGSRAPFLKPGPHRFEEPCRIRASREQQQHDGPRERHRSADVEPLWKRWTAPMAKPEQSRKRAWVILWVVCAADVADDRVPFSLGGFWGFPAFCRYALADRAIFGRSERI
jgi:hypothetical protein